jgi:hypothetical protein
LDSISKEEEPIFFSDTIENPKWCKATEEDLRALEKKNLGNHSNTKKIRTDWVLMSI